MRTRELTFALIPLLAAACTLDANGTSPPVDAGVHAVDAGVDAVAVTRPPEDAGAAPSDASCAAPTLFCVATGRCMPDCAACTGRPTECFACDETRKNPLGTCEPPGPAAYCVSGDYGARGHCACSDDDAGACPGASQVCADLGFETKVCATCGEVSTPGKKCKRGGACTTHGCD